MLDRCYRNLTNTFLRSDTVMFIFFVSVKKWLRNDIEDSLVHMPGYNCVRLDRDTDHPSTKKAGGGLCIYIRSDLNFEVMYKLNCCNSNIEALVIRLRNDRLRDMFVVNLYRPPSGNCEVAFEELKRISSEITDPNSKLDIVYTGDINIDSLSQSPNLKLLNDFCTELNLTSRITVPTRTTHKAATCLDVILTDMTHVMDCGVITNSINDHFPVYLIKRKESTKHENITFQGRSYRNFEESVFRGMLSSYNWGKFYASFDVETKFKVKKSQWFNDDLIEMSVNRDELFRIGKRTKDEAILSLARDYRNKVKSGVKNARSNYYNERIEMNKSDPTKFWSTISEMLPTSSENKISTVRLQKDDDLCLPSEAPDLINNYFTNIGPQLDSMIPDSTDPLIRRPQIRTLRFEPDISVKVVQELLTDLKPTKPSGCLNISTKLYLIAFSELIEQITFLFNLSIKTNKIPTAWKTGTVTPIPKKEDRTLFVNIRPITITHICGKMLERLVALRLEEHCESNHIYSNS